jgi:hypothetical protein
MLAPFPVCAAQRRAALLALQTAAADEAAAAGAGVAELCSPAGAALCSSTTKPQQEAETPAGLSMLQAEGLACGQSASTSSEQRCEVWPAAGCDSV